MTKDTVVVARFDHRHEGEIARGFLEDAGVRSVLAVDDAGGAFGDIRFVPSTARLLVRPDDADRAREVLADAGFPTELP